MLSSESAGSRNQMFSYLMLTKKQIKPMLDLLDNLTCSTCSAI